MCRKDEMLHVERDKDVELDAYKSRVLQLVQDLNVANAEIRRLTQLAKDANAAILTLSKRKP